ncbi:MAG: CDP-alcohol phosphatidyltransferase family protein [Pseudomonadota bacterium]
MTSSARIVAEGGTPVFGLSPGERRRRQLGRLGMAEARDGPEDPNALIVLRGDHVYTNDVLTSLLRASPGTLVTGRGGRVVAAKGADLAKTVEGGATAPGTDVTDLQALVGPEDEKLRKRATPVAESAATPGEAGIAEKALYDASYKGATDFVTKHVWPVPALTVTRWCARHRITPNQVTAVSAVLMLATFWLFWEGWFATGLIMGFAMVFLDTVDGKLARVTLTYSKFGEIFDHGIDLIHPPFWWWAWAHGCAVAGMPLADGGWTLGVIVAGYVIQRAEEGWFIARFGIEMHIWRPFDYAFRQITARRNPNLVILTVATVLGAPREGLIAVAIWVAVCLILHLVRILQAHATRRPVQSWLAERAG